MHSYGKHVVGAWYAHVSLLPHLEVAKRIRAEAGARLAGVSPSGNFNVIKLEPEPKRLSLLDYPGFFNEAFPILRRVWTVDLGVGSVRFRSYADSLNPPILHRKELLLPPDHPDLERMRALTAAAEVIGLFDDPRRIGFLRAWETLLGQKGYRVVGHELLPLGNEGSPYHAGELPTGFTGVVRHLTALSRSSLSAPVQALGRFGYLDGTRSLFDYGCGRGDDVRSLTENGIPASGWDPHYAPDGIRQPAPLVNLGFVINVIDDLDERIAALCGAYDLTQELLVVSAMLANQEAVKGVPYGDGVLTARHTFQKYYSQEELKGFVSEVLDAEPIPVGPGILFVFKDPEAEQRFLSERQRNRRTLHRLTQRPRSIVVSQRTDRSNPCEAHRPQLESLWAAWLSLGRTPERDEVAELTELIAAFGSFPKALQAAHDLNPDADILLKEAQAARRDDLEVYFALIQFTRRRPYRHLETRLQRDIKALFGGYSVVLAAGHTLLCRVADGAALAVACQDAVERGLGWMKGTDTLQLHTSLVEQLPPLIRVYIGCGTLFYGDVSSADLIKIHIHTGKLTLMNFDDFTGRALPRMTRRVKLNLRVQRLELFDYGEVHPPPYLYRKSRFINEEFPHYVEQLVFEDALDALGLFDLSGYGPPPGEFDAILSDHRYVVDGYRLIRSQALPDLDATCGRHFTYRDLIECGITQAHTGLPNLPRQVDTYTALLDLALQILDPLIDYYGMIRLTYGFCSPDLARHIPKCIAPKLDQHAAHELNRLGRPICDRLGAAVDFFVEDEDMHEVAQWIVAHLPFDRLYFYGRNLPIHVSYGPENRREAFEMVEHTPGRQMPRRFRIRRATLQ